jgi:acyl carrier protein
MERNELERAVKEILVENLGLGGPDEIKMQDHLVDDLEMDSLDAIEVISDVETQFDLEIDDQDANRLVTVQDLIDYVGQRITLQAQEEG